MQITENKIIYGPEDWVDGLNAQYGNDALILGNSIASANSFDPFRPYGIASPGRIPLATTNSSTVDGLVTCGVSKYNSSGITKAILGTNNGKIHELTISTNTITPSGTFPKTITGTTPVCEDMVTYRVGSTSYMFYSWRNSTTWDVGRYDFNTTFSASDSYFAGVATNGGTFNAPTTYQTDGKSYPHPMIVGANDILYVGDRNFIHQLDGQVTSNGTFTPAVLTLPTGYVITSFAKNETYIVVYAYREDQSDTTGSTYGQATAFFWDYVSEDPFKVIDLDDNYVNGGFSWKGTVGCFTTGRTIDDWASSKAKKSDLRLFNGSEFQSMASFDGEPPIYRGVDVRSDEIQWNTSGEIFYYGTRIKGNPNKLNKIASGGSGTTSGFFRTLSNLLTTASQYVCSGTGLYAFSDGYENSATCQVTTTMAQPEFPVESIGQVESIELFLYSKGATSNVQLTMNVFYLGGPTASQVVVANKAVFNNHYNKYRLDTSSKPFSWFTGLYIKLAWANGSSTSSAPQVRKVVVNYKPYKYS